MQKQRARSMHQSGVPSKNRKGQSGTKNANAKKGILIQTLKSQVVTLIVILVSELVVNFDADLSIYTILFLLVATMNTAYTRGMRQGLVSALLVVAYTYSVIISNNPGPWFSPAILQRGLVIAVAFPLLAYVIGRLKERNDALLLREKTARQEAQASERELRFMAESMPQKIFAIKPNGDSDYMNPQWEEYISDSGPQRRKTGWSMTVHPDDVQENQTLWKHSLKTGEPFQFEHRLKRNDGEYIWHITRAHALHDENGEIIMWIGSSTDIEDIKKRRQLEASTAKLIKQRAELMELSMAKDEFISLASHQLRTPATGVKQYLGIVLDGYAGKISPEQHALLEKASSSNERQLSVINDLLRVAQIDAGKVVLKKEAVDVKKLIADIINEQSSKFDSRNQKLKFIKSKDALKIDADATKIRMVIENIIDNAIKYTPEGKNITVRVKRSGAQAKISVIDEGVGIPKEDIDKIFQKFLRLSNPMSTEVGGTGLGLYWVNKVVELHDGAITVESNVGSGTTFTVSLPLDISPKKHAQIAVV